MSNKPEGFDRANGQGLNHDTDGNIENANNDLIGENTGEDTALSEEHAEPANDAADVANPTDAGSSNKGQGPSGENL